MHSKSDFILHEMMSAEDEIASLEDHHEIRLRPAGIATVQGREDCFLGIFHLHILLPHRTEHLDGKVLLHY